MIIRQVTRNDLDQCFKIESDSYGPEGAPRERIARRIDLYPQGFLVAELHQQIVGFVNSGATNKDDLSDEALKDMVGHDAEGKNIVIFSLAVDPKYRDKGISKLLMKEFIRRSVKLNKQNILLLCQPELITYYQIYGFIHRGLSQSNHGGLRWHEMVLPLGQIKSVDEIKEPL
ncbi:MAG TPA: GNAT family N-acetyltransferase [Anaerolineales bacterium]